MTEGTVDPAVVSSVANNAISTIGGHPANMSNLALSNAVSFQQGMNTVFAGLIAKAGELLVSMDVAEAAGVAPIGQVANKAAQTTPPVTP